MHKILVTGANGFIGKSTCKRLQQDGHVVVAGMRKVTDQTNAFFTPSLGSDANWLTALNGCNIVVHAAGRAHVLNETDADPLAVFREINVEGTLTLARQAATAGIKRFIFISSIGVNGASSNTPLKESDTPTPKDPYAISKLEAEIQLAKVAHQTGMEFVIIRPTLVYGYGAIGNFATLVKLISRGIPLPLTQVRNKRTFLSIDNLTDLISTCVLHPAAANQTFLAGDSEVVSTPEFIQLIGQASGRPARLFGIPSELLAFAARMARQEDKLNKLICNLWIDTSGTKQILGWTPPISQHEGIMRALIKR